MNRCPESGRQENLDKLDRPSGTEFDKAWIDGEMKLHQQVIEVADKWLVPNVKYDELKALLVKVFPSLIPHLKYANDLFQILPVFISKR